MDSQQIRNLQEAYIGVYDSDLREEQEFKSWVTELLDEGYDLSDYTWDEMYEIYNEERDPGVNEYKGGKKHSLATRVRKSNAVKPAGKKPEGETGGGYGQVRPDGKDPLDTPKKDERNFANVLAPKPKTFGRPFGRRYSDAAIENDAITSQMAKPKPKAPIKRVIKASYETDIYDVILEYLINEGYADTYEAAESIMVNMSEEWRESIVEARVDEGYVDYRKGKLPSGRTPQQSLGQRRTRNQSRANLTTNYDLLTPRNPVATKFKEREVRARQVGNEMDAHTSFGGKIMKALSPGLGNRSGAAPRVAYGEPNTDRHQLARNRRGEPSTKD